MKLFEMLFPDVHKDNWLVLFLLSILMGLYTLLCVIAFYLPGGIIEQKEIFFLGWLLAPLISIISVPVFIWIRSKFLKNVSNALHILLAVNSLLLGLIVSAINLSWHSTGSLLHITKLTYLSIFIIIPANLVVIFLVKTLHVSFSGTMLWVLTIIGSLGFLNFIGLYPYFDNRISIPKRFLIISLLLGGVIGVISFFLKFRKDCRFNRKWFFVLDFLIMGLVAIVCFDPSLSVSPFSQNFYLGPANRILHGGTMLVDTFSQYGTLSIYFLTLVLNGKILPFSYQGLSLLIAILFMGQFLIVYFLLIQLVKNRFHAILLLILSILLGFFSTMGVIQAFPSTGPYRFGLIYLLLAVILLRSRFPSFSKVSFFIEYGLVGVAFLWSFETFFYVGFPYLGICLFESFSELVSVKVPLRRFLGRLAYFILSLVITLGLFTIFTYSRAKAMPEWDIYLDFIKSYAYDGLGSILIDTWSPWIFPVCIYFSSLLIFIFRYLYLKDRENTGEDKIVLGLTLFGIVQFTYYIGRSHPNNLFHISIPAIILLGYWLLKFSQKKDFPELLRISSKVVFFSGAVLIILTSSPSLIGKYKANDTGLSFLSNINTRRLDGGEVDKWLLSEKALLVSGSQDPQVAEARQLIQKYMPEQKKVPLLLSATNTPEVFFASNRYNSFPISDITEDSISAKNTIRILEYPLPLKIGDYLIIEKNPSNYVEISIDYNIAIRLLDKICGEFSLQYVESSSHGVSVVRLEPHHDSADLYCETIHELEKKTLSP